MDIPANILFLTFAVTITLEAVVILLLLSDRKLLTVLFAVVAVHMFTHPLGAATFYILGVNLLLVEFMVTLFEAGLYRKLFSISISRALVISISANALSFFVGPIIRSLFFNF